MIAETRTILEVIKKHHSSMDDRSKEIAIEVLTGSKNTCNRIIDSLDMGDMEYITPLQNDVNEIDECLELLS